MPVVTGEELAVAVVPIGRDELIVDLFHRRGSALLGLARTLVDSREEAEEVVQEAFERLVASFVRLDEVAQRRSLSHRDRAQPRPQPAAAPAHRTRQGPSAAAADDRLRRVDMGG